MMFADGSGPGAKAPLPNWVPQSAQRYLLHTETGLSMRAVARTAGCHASTVMRQVRQLENRRDDPLIDDALRRLGREHFQIAPETQKKETSNMNAAVRYTKGSSAEPNIDREARRILRRLGETGAVLAVASELDKAVVVRNMPNGKNAKTAVVQREIAEAMALKDWIKCTKSGKIAQYEITSSGRAALKRLLSARDVTQPGFNDAQAVFGDQHRIWDKKEVAEGEEGSSRRFRYNAAESPLAGLARRRNKRGEPFLSDDLVAAGERLREDFELAHMGPRVAQNWEKFLTGTDRGSVRSDNNITEGPSAARERVSSALKDLGPGLGDVVLRCCCYLEGMETAEKRLGWSARSGKIVLRIALQRLQQHYDEKHGKYGPLIG